MKLYAVEVTKILYVLAGSRGEAESIASRNAHHDDGDADVTATDANPADVDPDWLDSLPWGENPSGHTVRDCLEAQAREAE